MVRTPPAPSAAEHIRSTLLCTRGATLVAAGTQTVRTRSQFLQGNGDLLLVVTRPGPLTLRDGQAAVLELTDTAAIALREPVRSLIWLRGTLRAVPDQRAVVRGLAAACPDPSLLDVGHDAELVRLELLRAVVADATGAEPVDPATVLAAEPDPFCLDEAAWVRHLDVEHSDLVGLLARRLPAELRGGRLRPLGIDRFGIRLRVERHGGDTDVGLAFPTPAPDAPALVRGLRALMGCPFLGGLHARS